MLVIPANAGIQLLPLPLLANAETHLPLLVIPANAGIQLLPLPLLVIPAKAGIHFAVAVADAVTCKGWVHRA